MQAASAAVVLGDELSICRGPKDHINGLAAGYSNGAWFSDRGFPSAGRVKERRAKTSGGPERSRGEGRGGEGMEEGWRGAEWRRSRGA